MRKLESVRNVIENVFLVGIALAFLAAGVLEYPIHFGVGLIVLLTLAFWVWRIAKKGQKAFAEKKRFFENVVRTTYADVAPPPSFEFSFSFGFPSFTIKFRSKAEMEEQKERNKAFKATVAELCKGYRTRAHGPFDVEKGVFIYYEGFFEDANAVRH